MLYDEIQATKKLVEEMREEKITESIAEVSVSKAAKTLRIGSEAVIRAIENGKLKARVYRDKDRKKRYRLRISDIKDFQDRTSTVPIWERPNFETAESIAERIFGA